MHWGQRIAINCGISKKIRTPIFPEPLQASCSVAPSTADQWRLRVSFSVEHLPILAQLLLLSPWSEVDEKGTLVQSCTELHQQSPPSDRNNKKQTLFDEGLPRIHTRSNPV